MKRILPTIALLFTLGAAAGLAHAEPEVDSASSSSLSICARGACFDCDQPESCVFTYDGKQTELGLTIEPTETALGRPCTGKPGETCASCTSTAVTMSCTVKVLGHGCTFGNHVNFGGWLICD